MAGRGQSQHGQIARGLHLPPENRAETLERLLTVPVSSDRSLPRTVSQRVLLFLQAPSRAKAERFAAIYPCAQDKTSDGFTEQFDGRTVPGVQEGTAGGTSRQRSSSLRFLFHVEENIN